MTGDSPEPEEVALLEALKSARGDRARTVAVLWTWLELHMVDLGDLLEKPPAILAAAVDAEPFEEVTNEDLTAILESPVRNSAELLARVALAMGKVTVPLVELSRGFDDQEVIVAWSASELVKRMGGDDYPPSAQEHPSLTTLAPNLVVCPRVVNQIELAVLRPSGPVWEAAKQSMSRGLAHGSSAPLNIHLDTLGEHGMSGWTDDETREVGSYEPDRIDPEDEARCVGAARQAVREATGKSSLLVMPELAATPVVLEAIQGELAEQAEAPALTVVGMYHQSVEESEPPSPLIAGEELARRVNEAVVFGPDGSELWRHRKLTCAEGKLSDRRQHVVEDIRLGEKVTVVSTPLGNVAVLICLDAFADHARDRLAKSPANVLLVPSLSPKVLRHRDSLQHLVQLIWGIAFVCNRSPGFNGDGSVWNAYDNRSFWVVQRGQLQVFPKAKDDAGHPSFTFRLRGDGDQPEQDDAADSGFDREEGDLDEPEP